MQRDGNVRREMEILKNKQKKNARDWKHCRKNKEYLWRAYQLTRPSWGEKSLRKYICKEIESSKAKKHREKKIVKKKKPE